MDLVAGVRKEGSRANMTFPISGGRTEFKWSDVKDSSHRENYLGHSLMAPVGRWQQEKIFRGTPRAMKAMKKRKLANNAKSSSE
ncbi:uncharacterized protein N7477_004619 [Penicillium maclennaniae]|uniref:uncharacterized protein n=1 Tax=Penicillium maclennaniae TaxID=1343394 RepID=UPI0025409315|nr:uncharacterized protein N7477_004619 [Penicillium maclennaniae]KAJ5674685.1 hypothetical protein N7477_004619 [Penicillium maclennaniae]